MKFKLARWEVRDITPEEIWGLSRAISTVSRFGFPVDDGAQIKSNFALIFPIDGNEDILHDWVEENSSLENEEDFEDVFKRDHGGLPEEMKYIHIGLAVGKDLVDNLIDWNSGRTKFKSPITIFKGDEFNFSLVDNKLQYFEYSAGKEYKLNNLHKLFLCGSNWDFEKSWISD